MEVARRGARLAHATTFVVGSVALVLQFVLVAQGHAVLDDVDPPGAVTRVVRFFSYLTIWSNLLATVTSGLLALDPRRDGTWWRALRMNGLVLVFVSGVVHFFFLRPLLDLHGADLLADRLLHVAVPVLTVVAWLGWGPRGQARLGELGRFLVLPVAWIAYTLVRGAVVSWYPYPFIDVDAHGYGVVALNCLGVGALMLALFALAAWLDRRLAG
jgi:hypothetical protein